MGVGWSCNKLRFLVPPFSKKNNVKLKLLRSEKLRLKAALQQRSTFFQFGGRLTRWLRSFFPFIKSSLIACHKSSKTEMVVLLMLLLFSQQHNPRWYQFRTPSEPPWNETKYITWRDKYEPWVEVPIAAPQSKTRKRSISVSDDKIRYMLQHTYSELAHC